MLKELKYEYENKHIDKHEYMHKMYENHKILEEYRQFISSTNVKEIDITQNEIIFNIDINGNIIKLIQEKGSAYSIPLGYLNFNGYENEEYDFITNMMMPDYTVFDIGANVGWYSINLLKNTPNLELYSFEPISDTYDILKRNFEINDLSSNRLFNIGFYKESKMLEFYYDKECTAASSIANLRDAYNTQKTDCKVLKLDDFVKDNKIKKIDFIKCDVEGSELFVYQGGINAIKEYRPIVFSEMLRKWSAKFSYHPNDIIDFFKNLNYNCYVISNKKLKKFDLVDENTLETNYLFFHEHKHRNIVNHLMKG